MTSIINFKIQQNDDGTLSLLVSTINEKAELKVNTNHRFDYKLTKSDLGKTHLSQINCVDEIKKEKAP